MSHWSEAGFTLAQSVAELGIGLLSMEIRY